MMATGPAPPSDHASADALSTSNTRREHRRRALCQCEWELCCRRAPPPKSMPQEWEAATDRGGGERQSRSS